MFIKYDSDESKNLIVKIGFDEYDPENESLRQSVQESIKTLIKTHIAKINDKLYEAKKQEDKLKKEIAEKEKQKVNK